MTFLFLLKDTHAHIHKEELPKNRNINTMVMSIRVKSPKLSFMAVGFHDVCYYLTCQFVGNSVGGFTVFVKQSSADVLVTLLSSGDYQDHP